jgi:hypothetical protein
MFIINIMVNYELENDLCVYLSRCRLVCVYLLFLCASSRLAAVFAAAVAECEDDVCDGADDGAEQQGDTNRTKQRKEVELLCQLLADRAGNELLLRYDLRRTDRVIAQFGHVVRPIVCDRRAGGSATIGMRQRVGNFGKSLVKGGGGGIF